MSFLVIRPLNFQKLMQSIPFYILLKYSASLGFEFMFSFIAVIFLLDMQITSNLSDLAY